jgi:hypothetical protein
MGNTDVSKFEIPEEAIDYAVKRNPAQMFQQGAEMLKGLFSALESESHLARAPIA